MAVFETLLLLLSACVGLAVLAETLNVPRAVCLVVGGMALALVPGLPDVELDPELALALFLPPLLQLSAYRTDWPAFRTHLGPILLLAVGAVFFSAACVAVVTKLLVPGLPLWAAIALGAIVAPPDAVAATAVLKQFNLPKRIVTVLEGESLINDASSLVLYRLAIGAVLAGEATFAQGAGLFVAASLGGAAIGWGVGRAAMWVFARINDTLLDITVSLLAGVCAYLAAERLHVSGVLAAVMCGSTLGRRQHAAFTARTRLELRSVWDFVEFVLASLVFMLIGLQLRGVVHRLQDYNGFGLLIIGAAVSLTLIVSRFVWVFPWTALPRLFIRRPDAGGTDRPWAHATIVSWAGMRGVVSLAAALALPARFPGRDLIVFLAFCAIAATLVLQGATLGGVIRALKVAQPPATLPEPDTAEARAEIAAVSLEAVKEEAETAPSPERAEAAAQLVQEYEIRADRARVENVDADAKAEQLDAQHRIRLQAIARARERLQTRTDALDADAHRALAEELDLEEQQIRRALGEPDPRTPASAV